MFPQNQIAPKNLVQNPQNLPLEPPIDDKDLQNQIKGLQDSSSDEILEARKDRFFGLEKPKTANKAFGSVSDFLLFFENRNPNIKEFAKKLTEIENLKEAIAFERLYEEIQPVIRDCLAKQWEKKREHKEDDKENKYSKQFEGRFKSWDEFYGKILHVYTLSGFLYRNMNFYLRVEDWMDLNDLLPYTFCLLKAFLRESIVAKSFASLNKRLKSDKLVLYRGAKFESQVMDFYDPNKTKNFSWHAVTSTSTRQRAAEYFTKEPSQDQTSVLFIIEVDLALLNNKHVNFLDIKDYSHFSPEEEIILAPGSIFELISIKKKGSPMLINLKLVTNPATLAHQGQFMHGTLQSVMKKENELRVVCLKEKELSNAIKHCAGNQLIGELEFYICEFNKRNSEILLKALPTLEGLTCLTFCSVLFKEDDDIERILELIGKLKMKKLEILSCFSTNKHLRIVQRRLNDLAGLEHFKLSFIEGNDITEDLTREFIDKAIKRLKPECVFDLSLGNDLNFLFKGARDNKFKEKLNHQLSRILKDVRRDELRGLYGNIMEVKPKHSWHEGKFLAGLKTNPKEELFEEVVEEEREVIGKCLPSYSFAENNDLKLAEGNLNDLLSSRYRENKHDLERLEINFVECKVLTNWHLCLKGVENFASLTALHLNLSKCENITDIGLQNLSIYGLQKLSSLTRLEIKIEGCFNLTDEGLMFLFLEGIRCLENLASLSLSFGFYLGGGISDESLNVLASILNPKTLKKLQLNFQDCNRMTDLGVKALLCSGIQRLELLENLNFAIPNFQHLTDENLQDFSLQSLQRLTSLSLDLSCQNIASKITSKGIASLGEKIGHLQRLESLKLNLDGVGKITLEELAKGLSKLTSLKTLDLGLSWMTDGAIEILCSEGLQKLKTLTSLELRFGRCPNIENKSLRALSDFGLKYLTNLVSLRLSFNTCSLITSEGLGYLGYEGLVYLENLEALDLSFVQCEQITDEGLEVLGREGIQQLMTLKSLRLNFNSCLNITSDGMIFLSQEGISKLAFLETLSLSFDSTGITSEGLQAFLDGEMKNMLSLASLNLSFNDCQMLTNLDQLSLAGLGSLKSVNLDFAFCKQVTPNMLKELVNKTPRCFMPYPAQMKLEIRSKNPLAVENISVAKVILRSQFGYCFKENPEVASLSLAGIAAKSKRGINKLKLDFENLFLSEEFIREILKENTIIESLTSFEVNFNNSRNFVRNSILSCLWRHGIQYMTSLETLSVNLDEHKKITNFGVIILCGKGIQHLKKLNSLELSFVNCRKITDKALKGIVSEGIQHLHSLKKLSLNFNLCSKISDKGLRFLAKQGLQKLESLSILELNFGQGSNERKEILESQQRYGNSLNPQLFSERTVQIGIQRLMSYAGLSYSKRITDKGLRNLCNEGIRNLKNLKTLCLNFEGREQITNYGLKSFEGPKSISQLELNFDWCKKITDEGLEFLGINGIKSLENLTSLSLSFDGFLSISDEGLYRLYSEGIMKLKNLEDLNMSFDGCINIKANPTKGNDSLNLLESTILDPKLNKFQNIIEGGFKDTFEKSHLKKFVVILNDRFSNKLKRFTLKRPVRNQVKEKYNLVKKSVILESLPNFWWKGDKKTREIDLLELLEKMKTPLPTDFHLYFIAEENLTDERLHNLCSRDFQAFLSLTCLKLEFAKFNSITERGIKSLSTDVLKNLQNLTKLDLVFNQHTQVTSEGLTSLCQDGIQYLQNLKRLSLCFARCQEITDEGIESLCHENVLQDKPLEFLSLDLSGCVKITENGFKTLFQKGIQNYKGLTSLDLKFNGCQEMKDMQLLQGLEHLALIIDLSLSFYGCQQITDKALGALLLSGNLLKCLTRLNLNFKNCQEITDQGIQNLCEFGLSSFGKTLTHLCLLFDYCFKITAKGLKNLANLGIKNFQSLKSLILSFNHCSQIKNEGLEWLAVEGVQHAKLLSSLSLSFQYCDRISSEGLKNLSAQGIQYLKLLNELILDFEMTDIRTDEGLQSLCYDGLRYLIETLTVVKLRFPRWDTSFTEEGIEDFLCNGVGSLYLLNQFQFKGDLRLHDFWKYGLSGLESLEILDISFLCSVDLQDLMEFVGTIESLKSLVELSLDFSLCNGDEDSQNIKYLQNTLNYQLQLPRLCRPFEVNGKLLNNTVAVQRRRLAENKSQVCIIYSNEPSFYTPEKPEKIVTSLEKAIGSSYEDPLDSLNIEVKNGRLIDSQALEFFTISGGSLNLKHLKSLSLKFDEYSQMTEAGFAAFICREIKPLSSLKELDLSFIGCKNLTDSGFKYLCDEVIRPLKLTSLNLNLGQCHDMTDVGLKYLFSEGILNFELLEKFGLGFAGCRKITDEGLISLCDKLNQAESLTVLHLNFDQCPGISDEGLKILVTKGIQERSSLSELSFSFVDCQRISYDTSVAMLKILNYFGFE